MDTFHQVLVELRGTGTTSRPGPGVLGPHHVQDPGGPHHVQDPGDHIMRCDSSLVSFMKINPTNSSESWIKQCFSMINQVKRVNGVNICSSARPALLPVHIGDDHTSSLYTDGPI